RERYSPVEVRPAQTPAHSRPLIPYTTTRDTIHLDGLLGRPAEGLDINIHHRVGQCMTARQG
ncbi:hypothetical protein ACWCPS_39830, partial [Streptomyces mauvecolor]